MSAEVVGQETSNGSFYINNFLNFHFILRCF